MRMPARNGAWKRSSRWPSRSASAACAETPRTGAGRRSPSPRGAPSPPLRGCGGRSRSPTRRAAPAPARRRRRRPASPAAIGPASRRRDLLDQPPAGAHLHQLADLGRAFRQGADLIGSSHDVREDTEAAVILDEHHPGKGWSSDRSMSVVKWRVIVEARARSRTRRPISMFRSSAASVTLADVTKTASSSTTTAFGVEDAVRVERARVVEDARAGCARPILLPEAVGEPPHQGLGGRSCRPSGAGR